MREHGWCLRRLLEFARRHVGGCERSLSGKTERRLRVLDMVREGAESRECREESHGDEEDEEEEEEGAAEER